MSLALNNWVQNFYLKTFEKVCFRNVSRCVKRKRVDKTNAAYATTDKQTKMNCNRGTALERSVSNYCVLGVGLGVRGA